MKKNGNPLITVIVPCYKVEQYLPKCINCLLLQTYPNVEIILVNDGSPDRCGLICDEYSQKDSRVKVIHKENGGQSEARNMAIDEAKGEWITFVDADDYVTSDYVETLYDVALKYKCEVSVACYKSFREGETPQRASSYSWDERLDAQLAVEEMFYQKRFDTYPWAKLYHRRLFETQIRYPKGLIYEDLATTYLLLLNSNGVAFSSKIIYYYLLRPSSTEGKFDPKKIQIGLAITNMMEKNMALMRPIESAYLCRKFCLFFHILMPMPSNIAGADTLISFIRENRWRVICNTRARKKARVAALLSYLGIDFVKFIFRIFN